MKVFEYLISIIMIFLMFLAGIIVYFSFHINRDGLVEFNNKVLISINSNDMSSAILKGDLIVLDEVELSNFQINNVVAYFSSDNDGNKIVKVARIIDGKVENNSDYQFLMKADNSMHKEYVDGDKLIGRWTSTKIPFFGFVLMFLLSKKGYILGFVLPLTVYFIYQVVCLVISYVSDKSDREVEIL